MYIYIGSIYRISYSYPALFAADDNFNRKLVPNPHFQTLG